MRAIRLSEFGNQFGNTDGLFLDNVPTPEPDAGEVRVRLTHRPVHPADFFVIAGLYPVKPPELPGSPGLEGAGYIDALGSGVNGWTKGQRVIPLAIKCSCWAEYMIVKPDQLVAVHDKLSDESAAQFFGNPVTAWGMLTDELGLQAGDWVLQTGASSVLAKLAIQIAKHKGYKLINLVHRPEQVKELQELGADVALSSTDEIWLEQVMKLTNGQGVKGAMDAVAGELGARVMALLQPGGKMLTYGVLAGEFTSPVNTVDMLFRGTTLKGFWINNWLASKTPAQQNSELGELMNLMVTGKVTLPPTEARYDLADFKKALAHAQQSGRHGKVLLTG
jgi:NADPH:quinone reductase